jgi:hypothetical protein
LNDGFHGRIVPGKAETIPIGQNHLAMVEVQSGSLRGIS